MVRAKAPSLADDLRLIDGLEEQAAALPAPAWPENLVGRPSAEPPVLWHAGCFRALTKGNARPGDVDDTTRARLLYHLHWLCRHFGSIDEACLPRVSVIIPVYNRAHLIGPTLESCFGQTSSSVEIVLTDDGSTDDLDAALAPYAERIVLIRQENRGISHARRAAIDAASGDFVHFLDSDDFFLPDCVADKLAAFSAVPDAELCFGGVVGYDPDLTRRAFISYENPGGDPFCPTTDMLRSIAHQLPFLPSSVMMPRWVLLEMNAFHEGLRRGEEIRLWFSLATRRPKVIGTIGETIVRRYHAGSLGWLIDEPSCSHAIAILMNLCDLLADSALWPSAFRYLHALAFNNVWQEVNGGKAPDLSAWRSRLIGETAALGGESGAHDRSPMPLIVLLLAGLRSIRDELGLADRARYAFHIALDTALEGAARSAAPMTDKDVAWWLAPEHVGILGPSAARVLASQAEEAEMDTGRRHLLPAIRLMLHLANPAFEPERFGPMTLSGIAANRVHVRSEQKGTVARFRAAVLDQIPFGGRQRSGTIAIDLLDRVIAGGPWALWRATILERRKWHALEQLLVGERRQSVHLEALRGIVFGPEAPASEDRPALQAKARFHAKALARALGSVERRHQASAAIVINAVGAGDGLAASIDSALAQTGVGIEIVVSGDRHDPAFATCVARYGAKVRTVARVRPDRAGAFNVGMAHCFADFVVLADGGDIVEADGVAAHVAAFDDEPRAELAWSSTVARTPASSGGLMDDAIAGRGIGVGEWMAPRWFVLDAGPVDRWLGAHAFARYAFRFAQRDPVAVRVARPLIARSGTYPVADTVSPLLRSAVEMLNLADLLAAPRHWRHCFALATRMRLDAGSDSAPRRETIVHALAAERLDGAIARLGDGMNRDGISPLLPIALVLAGLAASSGETSGRYLQMLTEAARSAAPVTDRDRCYLERTSLTSVGPDEISVGLKRLESSDFEIPSRLAVAIALICEAAEHGASASRRLQEASDPRSR